MGEGQALVHLWHMDITASSRRSSIVDIAQAVAGGALVTSAVTALLALLAWRVEPSCVPGTFTWDILSYDVIVFLAASAAVLAGTLFGALTRARRIDAGTVTLAAVSLSVTSVIIAVSIIVAPALWAGAQYNGPSMVMCSWGTAE
jgi:hypothetical protein